MNANGMDPLSSWYIDEKLNYFAFVFLASLILRVISCLLKSIHTEGFSKNVWKEFFIQLKGDRHIKIEELKEGDEFKKKVHILNGDYWFPMILGLIELSCFPILMFTRNWTLIGAWLAFKVLPHWKAWSDERSTFNRFLILQGLQLIYIALVLVPYVKLI